MQFVSPQHGQQHNQVYPAKQKGSRPERDRGQKHGHPTSQKCCLAVSTDKTTEIIDAKHHDFDQAGHQYKNASQPPCLPGEIVRKLSQPFMVDPWCTTYRVGVHVKTDKVVCFQQIFRIAKMPPDVWISHAPVRKMVDTPGQHCAKKHGK